MNTKIIFLTLFFLFGFVFQNCNDCNFGDIPDYFDIKGIGISHQKIDGSIISDDDQFVRFSDYEGFRIRYDVEYIASHTQKHSLYNSLSNQLFACSPDEPGEKGSKNEKIKNIIVITDKYYDSDHLAKDTINDIVAIKIPSQYNPISLNSFLSQEQSLINQEFLDFKLTKGPENIVEDFQITFILELSTNELYEVDSAQFRLGN